MADSKNVLSKEENIIKILILAILSIGFSALAFYLLSQYLLNLESNILIKSLIFFAGLLAMLILDTFFIKSLRKLGLIVLFIAVLATALFYQHFSNILLIGGIIFFVLTFWAVKEGADNLNNSLEIRFFKVAATFLPKLVTGLLIFLSIIFYVVYFGPNPVEIKAEKRNQLIGKALDFSQPIFKKWVPTFSSSMTFGDFLKTLTEQKIKASISEPLPAKVLKSATEKVSQELKLSLKKTTGPVSDSQPLTEVVYLAARHYLNNLPPSLQMFIGPVIIFFVFLFLKGLAFLFYWPIEFFAFLVFKLATVSGFATSTVESKSQEVIFLN